MNNNKIKSILSAHAIDTKEINGKLFAEELYTINQELRSEWVNVSRFSFKQLNDFLNY